MSEELLKLLSSLKSSPAVFLETARPDKENQNSYLFLNPQKIITFNRREEPDKFFKKAEEYLAQGFWLAGYFTYEFGYIFEDKLRGRLEDKKIDFPLAWLAFFKKPRLINHCLMSQPAALAEGLCKDFHLCKGSFNMNFPEYCSALKKIKHYLLNGDTYQVNFTLKYKADFTHPPAQLYLSLRSRQPTAYTAFINDGKRSIISFSPELFFRLDRRDIYMRPMKGTSARGISPRDDQASRAFLKNDIKNRAENIMIVDLLRNDLGRISSKGSVKVPSFFDIEEYPTLFQMTSTIRSRLKRNISLKEIFSALFPSGSVTGAPKIRTMQIINELELEPRDVYTGAVGFISPSGLGCFNVAIRTLIIENGKLEAGTGGGIVYDSSAQEEYQEALLKARFFLRTD